ncbi:hypothetical protein M3Y95_00944400 [Aphelenchoides besseyi]|nr:hypothetical protein M3Y95_00944400 [Aphelenchoides besseyi]
MTIILTVFFCLFAPPLAVYVHREQKDIWHFALNFLLFYTVIPAQIHAVYFCFVRKCISKKRSNVVTAVPDALPLAPQNAEQPPKPTVNTTTVTQNNEISVAPTVRASENALAIQATTVPPTVQPTTVPPK